MNVVSEELCEELFGLSGWEGGEFMWACPEKGNHFRRVQHFKTMHIDTCRNVPAYDLGYLLRKLPDFYLNRDPDGFYSIQLDELEASSHRQDADNLEDAAAKLAIELFKQGVLKKSST